MREGAHVQGPRLPPFRIEAELGSGGMGTVFRAVVEEPTAGLARGATVALKVLHPGLLEQPGFFKRFLREASIGRSIQHENVVRTYDCDQLVVDGAPHSFLVLEYVEGQTLRSLLDDLERVPEALCRHVGAEIAAGLAAIHEAGAVHRDLKPENVLITPDQQVKIMDLGVARLQDEAIRLSRTGHFVGSLLYAAPEAIDGRSAQLDGRVDLHALGLLLYELATGRHPFRHDNVRVLLNRILTEEPRRAGEVNPQLSPFLEELIHVLLVKDPAGRPESAAVVRRILTEGEASAWWRDRAQAIRRETRQPLRRIRVPRETALYGRDAPIAELVGRYEQARDGRGQVVLIEGEAGIGKTRLVDEFVHRLREAGEHLDFLHGSYPPGGAATAAGAFATAYREHFGAEGLETTLDPYLRTAPALVPAFAALLRGEPPPTGEVVLTRDSLPTAFIYATRALAHERTVVVLIDDLHFAPLEGRALFTSLALAISAHRVLLIGASRRRLPSDWIADVERLPHALRLPLGRLGPKDLVRLLEDAFHSERLARELAGPIALKSDGNPFFAFEIIRGLREGQLIRQRADGTWVTTRAIESITVPSTVLDLVEARVADLDRAERDLLDVAACCGFEFDPLLLAAATSTPPIEVLKTLGQIERRHRLVRASGRRFVFDHHQVQEALYEGLSVLLREAYHQSIATALETRHGAADRDPGDLDGALCVDLCEHLLAGGKDARALRYVERALTHLEQGYVNDRAVALAQRALEERRGLRGEARIRMLLRLDGLLDRLARRETQRTHLAEAERLAREIEAPALLATVLRARAWLAIQTGDPEAALPRLEEACALFRAAGDPRGEVHALGPIGVVHRLQGRYDEALRNQERALALARQLGERGTEASLTGGLGLVHLALGHYEDARSCFERHRDLATAVGATNSVAKATGNLGLALRALGRYAEAQACFEHRLDLARRIGDRRGETLATGNLGLVALDRGDVAAAQTWLEQHQALAEEISDRAATARGLGNLGLVHQALGHLDEARRLHEQHLALTEELDDREGASRAVGNLGLALFGLGDYEGARARHAEHLERARALGHGEGLTLAHGNLGLTLLALDRREEAAFHLDRALDLAREQRDRQAEGHWLQGKGEAALQGDDLDTAAAFMEEALRLRREIGHGSGVVESQVRLGQVEARRGHADAAIALLEDGIRRAEALDHAGALVMAHVVRAGLPGGDPERARAVFGRLAGRLEADQRLEATNHLRAPLR